MLTQKKVMLIHVNTKVMLIQIDTFLIVDNRVVPCKSKAGGPMFPSFPVGFFSQERTAGNFILDPS